MMLKRPKQIEKTGEGWRVRLRDVEYRGILAFMLAGGFIYAAIISNEVAINALGPLTGSAIGWYFSRKGEEK